MQVVSICKFIIHLLTVVFHGSVSTGMAARRRVCFSATTPSEKVSEHEKSSRIYNNLRNSLTKNKNS